MFENRVLEEYLALTKAQRQGAGHYFMLSSSQIVPFTKQYYVSNSTGDGQGESRDMHMKFQCQNLQEKDHLGVLGIEGIIVLKYTLNRIEYGGVKWIGPAMDRF